MKLTDNEMISFSAQELKTGPLPTEERGLSRDDVRLLVTTPGKAAVSSHFKQLSDFLQAGDVLVVNTSATRPAAVGVSLPDGSPGRIHFSQRMNTREWLVEIRKVSGSVTRRWKDGEPHMKFSLPSGAVLALKNRYYAHRQWLDLWVASFHANQPVESYLQVQADPIAYDHLDHRFPLDYYQTWFAWQEGSAEMPSAGRPFTLELVSALLDKGIIIAPVLLHTGISSLEEGEAPYPEYVEVTPLTAAMLNSARRRKQRIIAVGTTVVRAVESAVDRKGRSVSFRGYTHLYLHESSKIRVVDGLLTGFHEPGASHLEMLRAIGGREQVEMAYHEALAGGYHWHQFGDMHLLFNKNQKKNGAGTIIKKK